jgi:hypothetical protein
MTIASKALIIGQLGNIGQAIVQLGVGGADQGHAHIAEHLSAPGTAQGGKVVGQVRRILKAHAMFLQEGSTTFRVLQDAPNAQSQVIVVRELGARLRGRTLGREAFERFKERLVYSGGGSGIRH